MNAAPPTALTRDQFLAGIRASGVLTDRQFETAIGALTPFQKSAREVADFLVGGDWLTRFQAERLLHCKPEGFVLGPYVLVDYLGKTDTGRSFKAIHRTMNRAVAVLVLKLELTASDGVREAIRAQARCAARMAHPNVLTLLDVNTAGGRTYLVHEYVDGTDAGRLVRTNGPLPVPRACEFVRQAAVGLQHAHDKHTPHGRLCPAAMLVGRPGGNGPQDKPVVKVSGLGLGVFTGIDGAAEYAAPELTTDPTPTAAADLFALGGVFHFLLTGKPPHAATPIQTLRRDVPAAVAVVLNAMLATDPPHRPASAADVADTLTAFAVDDSAQIDFSLPTTLSSSASALSGGAVSLPVGIPITVTPPLPPQSVRSPFAELNATDSSVGVSEETPVSGRAVYTPVQTVRRRRTTSRRGTRARKQDSKLSLWLGLLAAVVVLALAGAALAVLAAVIR